MPESNTPIALSLPVMSKLWDRPARFDCQAPFHRPGRNQTPAARLRVIPCKDRFSRSVPSDESTEPSCDTFQFAEDKNNVTCHPGKGPARRSQAAFGESARAWSV